MESGHPRGRRSWSECRGVSPPSGKGAPAQSSFYAQRDWHAAGEHLRIRPHSSRNARCGLREARWLVALCAIFARRHGSAAFRQCAIQQGHRRPCRRPARHEASGHVVRQDIVCQSLRDCPHPKASVRHLRKERGWTQDDLAGEVGIEQGALSLIENARANPSLLVIETIAKKLDVEVAELFAQKARSKRTKDR
ncbi:helix-turn-helix transcriptional regulator [Bradyrhizobium sp. USDA 4529]